MWKALRYCATSGSDQRSQHRGVTSQIALGRYTLHSCGSVMFVYQRLTNRLQLRYRCQLIFHGCLFGKNTFLTGLKCVWPGMYNLYLFTFYIEDYKSIPYLENIFYKSRIFIKSKIELKKKYGQLKMGCHLFEQGKISHEKETYFENFIKKGQ